MKRIPKIGLLVMGAALMTAPFSTRADPMVPSETDAPITLLVDLSTGQILHSREADRRFLPASITKVMTAYLAFEMLADGRLSADQNFTVDDAVFDEWSGRGSTMYLVRGARVSVDELLRAVTTISANDGSILLAKGAASSVEVWVAQMNQSAQNLGMSASHFGTPNGWPDEGATYTTAHDLAVLSAAMIKRHPELYARYFGNRDMRHNGIAQSNHDPIIGVIRGADGIKTGFTREAGHNFLGSAKRGARRLVMIVAGTDGEAARARISRDYIRWGFDAFTPKQIISGGTILGHAQVQGGANSSVALLTSDPIIVDIARGVDANVEIALRYRGPLIAPIAAQSVVAQLKISIAGQEDFYVPLVAANDVSKANVWQRLANGVMGFFS